MFRNTGDKALTFAGQQNVRWGPKYLQHLTDVKTIIVFFLFFLFKMFVTCGCLL